jgi:hypothetical protein
MSSVNPTLNGPQAQPSLDRRVGAATVDATLAFLLWCGIAPPVFLEAGRVLEWVRGVCGALLLAMLVGEVLTGGTPGKWSFGLAVRNAADGAAASHAALWVRALVRESVVLLSVATVLVRDPTAAYVLWSLLLLAALIYLTVVYFFFARLDVSPFDAASETVVVSRRENDKVTR